MQEITAEWKNEYTGFSHADASLVASEIESIGDSATPSQILEKAKDEKTELHKCFVWDDTEAANRWRLETARRIVQNIVITRVDRPEDKPQIRYFYKAENGDGYKPITTIIKRQDSYKALVARAWGELAAFKAKYGALSEFEEICALIP